MSSSVLGIDTFRPILNMHWRDVGKFCDNYGHPAYIAHDSNPSVKADCPNRVEVNLYEDAHGNSCVGEAELFRDGVSVGKLTTDDCKKCGDACDGVHARVFAIHTLLYMPAEEAKKYCASYKVKVYCLYSANTSMTVPEDEKASSPDRIELFVRNVDGVHRVHSADYYRDGKVVDSLRGDYLAKPAATIQPTGSFLSFPPPKRQIALGSAAEGPTETATPTNSLNADQEKQVEEMVNALLTNSQPVIDEVIRQITAKRVNHIVDILSCQKPAVVDEVLKRVKDARSHPVPSYESIEDMRRCMKGYL